MVGENIFKCFRLTEGNLKPFGHLKSDTPDYTCHAWLSSERLICGTLSGRISIFSHGDFKARIKVHSVATFNQGYIFQFTSFTARKEGRNWRYFFSIDPRFILLLRKGLKLLRISTYRTLKKKELFRPWSPCLAAALQLRLQLAGCSSSAAYLKAKRLTIAKSVSPQWIYSRITEQREWQLSQNCQRPIKCYSICYCNSRHGFSKQTTNTAKLNQINELNQCWQGLYKKTGERTRILQEKKNKIKTTVIRH